MRRRGTPGNRQLHCSGGSNEGIAELRAPKRQKRAPRTSLRPKGRQLRRQLIDPREALRHELLDLRGAHNCGRGWILTIGCMELHFEASSSGAQQCSFISGPFFTRKSISVRRIWFCRAVNQAIWCKHVSRGQPACIIHACMDGFCVLSGSVYSCLQLQAFLSTAQMVFHGLHLHTGSKVRTQFFTSSRVSVPAASTAAAHWSTFSCAGQRHVKISFSSVYLYTTSNIFISACLPVCLSMHL